MNAPQLPPLDKRILRWNMDSLISRRCPICEAEGEPKFVRPDGLNVQLCAKCFTFFVSPAPSNDQLAAFYCGYDRSHRNVPRTDGEQLRKTYLKTNPNSDYRFQVITSLVNLKGKRVLDIGFGRGFFLYFLSQLGAEVTGLELDDGAIGYARDDLGISDVRNTDLLKLDDAERFDLILMMDLIEHVLGPLQYLKKASTLLSPGGIIVLFTPNASYSLKELEPILFRVDLEHMQYFSNTTCNYVSSKLGLEIVHLENVGYPFLTGLVEPTSLKHKLKAHISTLPGFEKAYRLLKGGQDLSRTGRYHLFCAFKRPDR